MHEDDTVPRPRQRRPRKRGVSGFTVVGVLLLAIGLACLGWIGYQYIGTDIVSKQAYAQQKTDLRQHWDQATPTPTPKASPGQSPAPARRIPGDAIALLRVPRFGADYEVPILSGTDSDTLAKGVGWYESSVRPGQVGNFALAGHRITHGEPFSRLLEIRKGDQVFVETQDKIYTYVMDTSPADLTVKDKDVWVLEPVPGKPGQAPTQPLITLTTCQDLFHSPDRSVGFGHLAATQNK